MILAVYFKKDAPTGQAVEPWLPDTWPALVYECETLETAQGSHPTASMYVTPGFLDGYKLAKKSEYDQALADSLKSWWQIF